MKTKTETKIAQAWVINQAAIETAKAVVKAMSKAAQTRARTGQRYAAGDMGLKAGGPSPRQPTFDWTAKDKYT